MKAFFPILFLFFLSLSVDALAATTGQQNAVWAGSLFLRGFDPTTREKLTDEKLQQLSERLRANGVRYVYLFAGPYGSDGKLPDYAFSKSACESLAFLKKMNPSLKVLSWIGGIEGKTVHVEKQDWVETSVGETAKLMVALPFDGVHIDLESVVFPKRSAPNVPFDQYDRQWVQFHKRLREKLPSAFISTTVVSTAPGARPWKHKHQVSDVMEVSRVVNQVSFMFYDTHLETAKSYRDGMQSQLEQIQEMKRALKEKAPEFLFGLGTFQSTKSLRGYRDIRFENVATTLTTLNELVARSSFPGRLIDGLAIYADWTTQPKDWARIQTHWMKH